MTNDNNNNDNASELITELISITPANELEERQRFITVAEEHGVRSRQLQIVDALLDMVQTARGDNDIMQPNNTTDRGKKKTDAIGEDDEDMDDDDINTGGGFIRTNMSEYNGQNNSDNDDDTQQQHKSTTSQQLHLREILGNLPSSTTSNLATSLTRLISYRVELESLLTGTQDTAANLEAMGMMSLSSSQSQLLTQDNNELGDDDDDEGGTDMQLRSGNSTKKLGEERRKLSAKAALTISKLGLKSALLYVELLGTKGAWGGGLVDVGGISAISALIRRWCVECRGRESVLGNNNNKKGGGRGKKQPPKKRFRVNDNPGKQRVVPSRKSVRISEVVSVMNKDDDDEMSDDAGGGKLNSTFQVEEPDEEPGANIPPLTEYEMITGGLRLAYALGRVPLQAEYKNWSSEAREFFLDGASAALGIASALLVGCSKGKDNNKENAAICQETVSSLEYALRMTVLPTKVPESSGDSSPDGLTAAPLRKKSSKSRRKSSLAASKEDAAAKKRLQESGIYLLRGLLPMFYLKMELPNGQAGKLAAYDTVSSLVVTITTSISEDIELNSNKVRMSKSPRDDLLDDSITPKRGGRKSISFAPSHTPAASGKKNKRESIGKTPNTTMIAPPSLKKSITPRRTRSSGSSAFSDRPTLHPVLSLIVGMLHKLFTGPGLERAEARSRVCTFGIQCLAQLPTLERSNLLRFVGDMCESKISSHRLLGVEMIGQILCQGWFWKDHEKASQTANWMFTPFSTFGEKASENDVSGGGSGGARSSEDSTANNPSSILLAALQGRLTDKSPTVRTRACLSLGEVVRKASLAQEEGRNLDGTIIASTPSKLTDEANIPSKALTVALCKIGTSLVQELRRRASTDDRATVRKSSIQAWLQMLNLAHRENKPEFVVSGLDISALCQLCNDPSVATRKAAANALTSLVQANYDSEEYNAQSSSLEMAWAQTVLPLVSDAEATCVMKAVEFFQQLVIDPIVELGKDTAEKLKDDDDNMRYFVAWRILSKLSDGSKEAGGSRNASGSLILALQKLFINAGKDSKSLAKNLFRAVYHCGAISLGLDRRSSLDSTMSHDDELEENLFDINTTAMRSGAWCLLDALTSCLTNTDNDAKVSSLANVSLNQAVRASNIDASFLALSLQKLRTLRDSEDVSSDKKSSLSVTSRDCLKVIAKMGSFVPLDDAESSFSDLLNDLESFTVSIDLVPAVVNALIALTKRMCDDSGKEVFSEVKSWVNRLLDQCEKAIESCFSRFSERGMINGDDEKFLSHVLFLIGELSMIGFSSQEESSSLSKKSKNDIMPTDREPVRGLLIRPSARTVHLVKLMLPNAMPMPNAAEDELIVTPSTTRALAFVTLGKLSLRDEALAKESLNILARELHKDSDSDPAVQSNALMVMGDLCVRYTNLVDKYLPFMAASLQAGEGKPTQVNSSSRLSLSFSRKTNGYSLVKKNAIMLLSSLLLQDYIKWRGLFIHRFLAAVADEDDEVSCLAQTALRGPLLSKQPNLLSNHFVGAVFVFNACKAHPIYAAEASGGGNGMTVDFEGTALVGSEGSHRRREVYEMMLGSMTDKQKLEVTARLAKEVLGGALETSGDLSFVCKLPSGGGGIKTATRLSGARIEAATNVLIDTLAILTSPEIKVGRGRGGEGEDDLVSVNSSRSADQQNVHKRRLLSKISRKHLMEIVVPILCSLKSVLEASHSPLLKNLMKYLGYIFRSYKSEVQEHLANQPTLLQELEYDMRQYEKKQKQRERDSVLYAEIVTD